MEDDKGLLDELDPGGFALAELEEMYQVEDEALGDPDP